MLTPRENFLEYLKPDGKPEYLNNSFQMFRFLMGDPCSKFIRGGRVRGVDSVDPWGTFIHFGADEPAAIPIVTQENQVIPDLEHWEDYLKVPDLKANCAEGWEGVRAQKEAMDSERFLSAVVVPTGIFERLHMLMTFEDMQNTFKYNMVFVLCAFAAVMLVIYPLAQNCAMAQFFVGADAHIRPSAFGRWRGRVDVGIDPYALGARKIPATSRRRRQMVPQQKSRANPAPRVTTSL